MEPVTIACMQVVSQVNTEQTASWRWIYTHIVSSIVQELGSRIPLNIM